MSAHPSAPADPVSRRRTFAIISHPDAGKTTLTEKLLLFGGAIQLAGQVKAKGDRRNTRSDWMGIEKERGISVMTSVMTFEYRDWVFNLLDTPGHEDFSEDTYRTLTAVDAAVMVLDAAKGVEARTLKLVEVCRLRDIPIVTFVNKCDRDTMDPFELLDDIENSLALDTTPKSWPIGRGKAFAGTYDLDDNTIRLKDAEEPIPVSGPDDPKIEALLMPHDFAQFKDEVELAQGAAKPFVAQSFLEGHLTPVYFGSALRDMGVQDLIDALGKFAPSPREQHAATRVVEAGEPKMTGFVFKIQANMDPNHRDRIAFMRVCSGKLQRGMKAKLVRTGKNIALTAPQFFFAQDRTVADEAFAGDIVGIPNHGTLRIGDTMTEGEDLAFRGVPSFAPEILRRVRVGDAMKAKKLKEALQQMAEEGVVQVFQPRDGTQPIVGVVGNLQLDVLKERLAAEYGLEISFEQTRFSVARWVTSEEPGKVEEFSRRDSSANCTDLDGDPVHLATSTFALKYEEDRWDMLKFSDVKDYQKG